jgi:uncharacterized protein DUF397
MERPDLGWRTSTYSREQYCVEVAAMDDDVVMRNSKDPDGPALRLTRPEFRAFIHSAQQGQFDDLI